MKRVGGTVVVRGSRLPLLAASHEDPRDPGVFRKILFELPGLPEGRVQMVNWAVLPEGKSFRPHYHEDMEEIFVLIAGTASVTVGKNSYGLNVGDAIRIPERSVHGMVNTGRAEVRYLVIGISRGSSGRTIVVNDCQE